MSGQAKRFIYFCGSIRGGRDDAALYKRIIDQLKQYGEVLTEHIGDPSLMEKEKGSDKFIHDRDMAWLLKSDDLSAMIRAAIGDKLLVKDYKEEDIPQILEEFFKSL